MLLLLLLLLLLLRYEPKGSSSLRWHRQSPRSDGTGETQAAFVWT